jgi:hypothetical protein
MFERERERERERVSLARYFTSVDIIATCEIVLDNFQDSYSIVTALTFHFK